MNFHTTPAISQAAIMRSHAFVLSRACARVTHTPHRTQHTRKHVPNDDDDVLFCGDVFARRRVLLHNARSRACVLSVTKDRWL